MASEMDINNKDPLIFTNYKTILQRSFVEMFRTDEFADAILICDGQRIRVHKFLLSAVSSFFDKMFKNHENNHKLLIKHVNYEDLMNVLTYIYNGRVDLHPEKMNSFFNAAKKLSVPTGFNEMSSSATSNDFAFEQQKNCDVSGQNH